MYLPGKDIFLFVAGGAKTEIKESAYWIHGMAGGMTSN